MEQFSDFMFMKDVDLGSKFNMSYRLRCLLNESINLTEYGKEVQSILFSPIIGEVVSPKSRYNKKKQSLILEYFIEPSEAIKADEYRFFHLLLNGIISSIKDLKKLPEDFDYISLIQDLKSLPFEQMKQVA